MADVGSTDAYALAQSVARRSYGRLLAFVAARTHDIAAAEDALGDAFAAALSHWPADGVPANPEAWLLTAARHRALDGFRHRAIEAAASAQLETLAQPGHDPHADLAALLPSAIGADGNPKAIPDDRLRLMFACAHPGIAAELRAPLILQTVLGFDAASIASAFRVAPSTMGQRLSRGKARIRQAGIPFRVPDAHDLAERLDAVLAAVYAAYSDGWTDPTGTQAQRRAMAGEALWLGRLTAALLPDQPEAQGLLALMLYLESRRIARRDAEGEYVPLESQDVALWDNAMQDESEQLLQQAAGAGHIGRYQLEAAVQSAHTARRLGKPTDWPAIVALYGALGEVTASPIVAINRAVALSHTEGPLAALQALQEVAEDRRVANYQPYWAARAELLMQSQQPAAARAAYQQAIGLEIDPAVRRFLQRRAALESPG